MASPVGRLTVTERDGAIVALGWGGPDRPAETALLHKAVAQLAAYFDGRRTAFDLPLRPDAPPATRRFLTALAGIPFGETRTYGDLGAELDLPPQAVGRLCGSNPLPILIPCHRVLAADGLGGYSGRGGIEAKVALLKLEGAASLLL